MTGKSMNVS